MGNDDNLQLDLIADDFKVVNADWVHLFRYIVENKSVAKMSGGAWKTYTVIKVLSGFEDGKTTKSLITISEYTGLSVSGVRKAIKELKDMGFLYSERYGRKNSYRIIERIPAQHISGSPLAIAEIPYRRLDAQNLINEIKNEFVKKLSGFEGVRDINIVINTGKIDNLVVGGDKKVNTEEDLHVEFSIVEEFNKKIAEKDSKKSL